MVMREVQDSLRRNWVAGYLSFVGGCSWPSRADRQTVPDGKSSTHSCPLDFRRWRWCVDRSPRLGDREVESAALQLHWRSAPFLLRLAW